MSDNPEELKLKYQRLLILSSEPLDKDKTNCLKKYGLILHMCNTQTSISKEDIIKDVEKYNKDFYEPADNPEFIRKGLSDLVKYNFLYEVR